jgi:hypothetical protein
MFQRPCVILREFQNLYLAKLQKFIKLKPLKLQVHKIIRLKYYLVVAEWCSIVCATLQYRSFNGFYKKYLLKILGKKKT